MSGYEKNTIFLFSVVYCSASAQQKPYQIALSYGPYAAPNFKQGHPKYYFSTDFNYHISKLWTITSGFTAGQFGYYDDIRSNAVDEVTRYTTSTTNARGYDFHAYVLAKYTIINADRFQVNVGLGAGMLTERLKYPYREPCSSGCAVFIGEQSSTRFEIPIKAEAYYLITDQIGLGLTTGLFVSPATSNPGFHVGPQFRIGL